MAGARVHPPGDGEGRMERGSWISGPGQTMARFGGEDRSERAAEGLVLDLWAWRDLRGPAETSWRWALSSSGESVDEAGRQGPSLAARVPSCPCPYHYPLSLPPLGLSPHRSPPENTRAGGTDSVNTPF